MDQGVEVIRRLAKGSNNDAVDSAKRAQLELHWSDGALGGATARKIYIITSTFGQTCSNCPFSSERPTGDIYVFVLK